MISPLYAAAACGSVALCLSAKNDNIFSDKRTKVATVDRKNHAIGTIAIACLGLIPGCGPAALISLNGNTVLRLISDKNRFTKDYLTTTVARTSMIYGIINRSPLALGISLGIRITNMAMNYFNSNKGLTKSNCISLALDASLLGAAALGSGPLFAGAVGAQLIWTIAQNFMILESLQYT